METQTHAADDKLIALEQVLDHVGVSKSVWYSYIRAGDAPRPVKLPGGRAARWWRSEIVAWCEALPRATGDLGPWGDDGELGRQRMEIQVTQQHTDRGVVGDGRHCPLLWRLPRLCPTPIARS